MRDAGTASPDAPTSARERAAVQVEPHRWALSRPARIFRRLARPRTVTSHVKRFCRPLTVEGQETLKDLGNPLLIIANHTSHFDTVIVLHLLPNHIFDRTAVVAAADRMYRDRIKGMWHSLRYNAFPISRGGGRKALAYSQWLLSNNWSLLIFPEGQRSRTGELLPFHGGPAILALTQPVPVLPIHIDGAHRILPPGERYSRPAPVHVRIGQPLTFPQGTQIGDAKAAMEEAVRALAHSTAETSRSASDR